MKRKIELLAPAGSNDALHAAVENGADAVYLGGKLFNARVQADNFDGDALRRALEYAHAKGVSIYLTLNTLVSDDEIEKALTFAVEARNSGIDGIIVQDLGLADALRRTMPDVPLHASTQMTIYDIDGVRALEKMGFSRVVLARELTLNEASEIAESTALDIEVFVHGALCVCYSGQCLMSSMIGGRSGNRGACAQPCRLPYTLVGSCSNSGNQSNDRKYGTDKDQKYLLSPKDICYLEYMPAIVRSGIHSLKIEGRMKSPEYVATVVRIYRKYLDMAIEACDTGKTEIEKLDIDPADMHDLLQIFNRGGFSHGYLNGKTGSDIMSYLKPNNSGIYMGKVREYDPKTRAVSVKLENDISVGDGIEIWAGGFDSPGGTVTSISKNDLYTGKGGTHHGLKGRGQYDVRTAEKGNIVSIGQFKGNIRPGMGIYKTMDITLMKRASESFAGDKRKKVNINGRFILKADSPVMLSVEDEDGNSVSVEGTVLPERAINRPISAERAIDQLSRTGSTPFIFSKLDVDIDDGLSIPVSEINEVRRNALEQLLKKRENRYYGVRSNVGISERISEVAGLVNIGSSERHRGRRQGSDKISIYVYRWSEDIDYAELGADRLYLPFTAQYKDGFGKTAAALRSAGTEVYAWIPSITRGSCGRLLERFIAEKDYHHFDGVLAANTGTLQRLSGIEGLTPALDISMNLYNSLSLKKVFLMGAESAAISPELSMQQIAGLAGEDVPVIEAAVYGRLPLMTSEYCPVGCTEGGFSLSKRCSGSCIRDEYRLKDRIGVEFPVLCDRLDCRSTILNSRVLFVPELLNRLRDSGVGIFRLYMWDEKPDAIREIVDLYKAELAGDTKKVLSYRHTIDRIKSEGYTNGYLKGKAK
jgi:putative protease